MDLAACARAVWVVMEHTTRAGAPRLLRACRLPLTAPRCVRRVFTDFAVIDVTEAGFVVREVVPGLSREDLQARSESPLTFAPDCRALRAPAL
jgi:3-oxoadipate CoA-transferase beta subunit